MTELLASAFLGGLAGSPHCLGMCGGFAAAASDAPLPYHLGRLSTYALLGLLAGAFGAAIPGPAWVVASVSGVLMVVFAARIAGILPAVHVSVPTLITRLGGSFIRREGALGRYGLGVVTAALPCGLVWTALGLAVASDHAAYGALTMVIFGLGTVPLLAGMAAGFRRLLERGRGPRLILAGLMLAAGLWSIAARARVVMAEGEAPACHGQH